MKKRIICLLCAAVLLLAAGCTAANLAQTEQETQQPQTEVSAQPKQFSDDPEIAAVWVNGGTTPDGRDYVETMSLLSDGDVLITIDYDDGFQTLSGTYTALNGILTVTINDTTPYDRVYQYERDANVLTLTGNDKTVTYRRSD